MPKGSLARQLETPPPDSGGSDGAYHDGGGSSVTRIRKIALLEEPSVSSTGIFPSPGVHRPSETSMLRSSIPPRPSSDPSTYDALLETLHAGACRVDRSMRVEYWNPAAERMTGYGLAEVIGRSFDDHSADGGAATAARRVSDSPLVLAMREGRSHQGELSMHKKDGSLVHVSIQSSPVIGPTGEVIGGVEIFTDISESVLLKRKLEEMERFAYIDSLTEVANRRWVDSALAQNLEEARRYGHTFGLVMFDVDNFKSVNDRYGHDVGDKVLKLVARTLAFNVRSFDTVGRWGGEELVAIVRHVDGPLLSRLADRLRTMVGRASVEVGREPLRVTVSVGATLARKEDTVELLVKRVDDLLYRSKRGGKDRVTLDI